MAEENAALYIQSRENVKQAELCKRLKFLGEMGKLAFAMENGHFRTYLRGRHWRLG